MGDGEKRDMKHETCGIGQAISVDDATRLRLSASPRLPYTPFPLLPFSLAFFLVVSALISACGSKPTDPRSVIPGDSLVYIESADLGKTLEAVTGNPKFQQLAKTKPNLSALNGVKVGIAVVGLEASEEPVTEENSIIDLQPHFVAVAETNAWGWQTKSFVEDRLGEFVNEAYGGAIELEITTRNDGEFYVWTSPAGQKAYALQQGSVVFFGNDESAIERCQAVRRGEAASIAASGKIPEGDRLAFGFVSEDGVGQIANLIGIQLAKGSGEDADVQSFVASVLPQILRNSTKELTWTATKAESGIEDKVTIALDNESATVFNETLVPAPASENGIASFVPDSAATATRYLLRDPQISWRSVVLTAGKKTDETSGMLLLAFSSSLFEPYGIEDPEPFLSSVGSPILTVKLVSDAEDAVAIAPVKDPARIKTAMAKEINFSLPPESQFGGEIWKSEDGEVAVAFLNNFVVSGGAETVIKCLEARSARAASPNETEFSRHLASSNAVAITVSNDADALRKLVGMFSAVSEESGPIALTSITETRFNRNGIERRTVSDFGWIGSIIKQLGQD